MVSLTSQLIALRRLSAAEDQQALAARRLSSGLNLADRTDTADSLSLSRRLTRVTSQLSSVQSSLDGGIAAVSAATGAVETTNSTLASMRAVLVAAKDLSADLGSLQSRFAALAGQLRTGVSSATFGSINLLATSGSTRYDAAPTNELGKTFSIDVDAERVRLLDTSGTSGILQRTFDLTSVAVTERGPSTFGLSGTGTQIDGVASLTPSTAGLSGIASSVDGKAADADAPATDGLSGTSASRDGTNATSPSMAGLSGPVDTVAGRGQRSARVEVKFANPVSALTKGDTVELSVTLNGDTRTVQAYTRSMSDTTSAKNEFQRAVTAAFGSGAPTVNVTASYDLVITAGSTDTLSVGSVRVVDGDDVTTSKLGMFADANMNWVNNSTVGGQNRSSEKYTFNIAGIDKNDRIALRIESRSAGSNTSTSGQHAANGTLTAFDITVSLQNVNNQADMVTAINNALNNGSGANDYFAAAISDANQLVIYHKTYGSSIRVSQVTAINGDGTAAGTPAYTATPTAAATATASSATTGSNFGGVTLQNGAALGFDLTINGTTRTVAITEGTVEAALSGRPDYVLGSGRIADVAQFALVARRAMAEASISSVDVAASGDRLRFTKTGTPIDGDSVTVSAVRSIASVATRATLLTGSDFSGPQTIGTNGAIGFTLSVNGAATTVSVIGADVENALSGQSGYASGSGVIADVASLARVVQAAMTRQNVNNVTVAAEGNRLRFTSVAAEAATLALSNVGGSSSATQAKAASGSDFASPVTLEGDAELRFDLDVNGAGPQTVRIRRSTVEAALGGIFGRTNGTGRIADAGEFALVAQRALSESGITGVSTETDGNRLVFTLAPGAGSIELSNVGTVASTAGTASLRTGSDFSGPMTVEAGASIQFDLVVDGGSPATVTIRQSTVEAALAGIGGRTAGSGAIADTQQLSLVLGRALDEASISGIAVTASGTRIELSKSVAGSGSIEIRNVLSLAAGATASGTTLDAIDLNSASMARMTSSERTALIDAFIRNLDGMTASVASVGNHLATVGRQLSIQSTHTTRLQAIETNRMNGQVKVDIDRETAKKTALDTRLALARQSLAIISESRKNVLNLLPALN